jgi:hypothetical protein
LDDTLKVPGITLNARLSHKILAQTTVAKVGLWQVSKAEEAWADEILAGLKAVRDTGYVPDRNDLLSICPNREWIADDPLLMQDVAFLRLHEQNVQTVGLVTTDFKLCRRMSEAIGINVLAISPETVITLFPRDSWTAEAKLSLKEQDRLLEMIDLKEKVSKPQHLFWDTGSLKAYAMRYQATLNDHGHKTGTLRKTELVWTDVVGGHRSCRTIEKVVKVPEAFRGRLFAANKVERNISIFTEDRSAKGPRPSFIRRNRDVVAKYAKKWTT